VTVLTDTERERLLHVYTDLMSLAQCEVPSVKASARAAVAHVAQALNGQGLLYDLYTNRWDE
jgi:hypothetical protein